MSNKMIIDVAFITLGYLLAGGVGAALVGMDEPQFISSDRYSSEARFTIYATIALFWPLALAATLAYQGFLLITTLAIGVRDIVRAHRKPRVPKAKVVDRDPFTLTGKDAERFLAEFDRVNKLKPDDPEYIAKQAFLDKCEAVYRRHRGER
jgi:hypothetical protein